MFKIQTEAIIHISAISYDAREGVTIIYTVSTLGKHLRKLGTIFISSMSPNRSTSANVLTLKNVALEPTFVTAYNIIAPKEHTR